MEEAMMNDELEALKETEANFESEIYKDDGQETEVNKDDGQETEIIKGIDQVTKMAAEGDLLNWRVIKARVPAFQWTEIKGDFKRELAEDPFRTQLAKGRQGRNVFRPPKIEKASHANQAQFPRSTLARGRQVVEQAHLEQQK